MDGTIKVCSLKWRYNAAAGTALLDEDPHRKNRFEGQRRVAGCMSTHVAGERLIMDYREITPHTIEQNRKAVTGTEGENGCRVECSVNRSETSVNKIEAASDSLHSAQGTPKLARHKTFESLGTKSFTRKGKKSRSGMQKLHGRCKKKAPRYSGSLTPLASEVAPSRLPYGT
ncbi:hypothetical protein EVAR_94145_1 [Eumeta japonica]|uniref:Uncharacterized protein n=1 Tax=Eumeta variegata TaxID=151549 RepID=A0A4C1U6V7_EUMVA|nr:hypothetical protein EVAR_94145_1 [Eumeta japonica]